MEHLVYVIALAVVQGVAEFLPISSSGHLNLLGALCGFSESENLSLGILLHAGSLSAIIVFYFKVLLGFFKKENLHLGVMVVIATIPAAAAGLTIKSIPALEKLLFGNLYITGAGFILTAMALWLADRAAVKLRNEATPLAKISWRQAVITGLVQGVAILPGISRSGSTIAAGTISGVERESAGTFSFLLAIPAIGGAAAIELMKLFKEGNSSPAESFGAGSLAIGFVVSAAVSYAALCLLVKLINRGKLHCFGYYLAPLGLAVIVAKLFFLN